MHTRALAIVTACALAALAAPGCDDNHCPGPGDSRDPGAQPSADEVDLAGFPCAEGRECADAQAFIEGTCCSAGDPLQHLAQGKGAEVVDIESNGELAILCGGFGADILDVSDPSCPKSLGRASERCQRIAFGPLDGNGDQLFYLAHHGDTWVRTPFLRTYRINRDGHIIETHAIEDPDILFEGLAYRDGYLYVATHGGGLRVYQLDEQGNPLFVSDLQGFENAWKIAISGQRAYVADAEGGLVVVSLADPAAPAIVQTVETLGLARDVVAATITDAAGGSGERVFVALGGSGVEVFEASGPAGELASVGHIATGGSAQAVALGEQRLAVASWDHVAIYDPASLRLLASERLRPYPTLEQDFGVEMIGDQLYVGEWEGLHTLRYRPGFVAPNLWLDDELFSFAPGERDARAVVVRNRGPVPLYIDEIILTDRSLSVDKSSLTLAPGQAGSFELTFTPPAARGESIMTLVSNDPDFGGELGVGAITRESDRIDIGETLGPEFGFLDPSGEVSALEGKVVVLAYFALF